VFRETAHASAPASFRLQQRFCWAGARVEEALYARTEAAASTLLGEACITSANFMVKLNDDLHSLTLADRALQAAAAGEEPLTAADAQRAVATVLRRTGAVQTSRRSVARGASFHPAPGRLLRLGAGGAPGGSAIGAVEHPIACAKRRSLPPAGRCECMTPSTDNPGATALGGVGARPVRHSRTSPRSAFGCPVPFGNWMSSESWRSSPSCVMSLM
jgi:hypothetical protein